MKATIQGLDHIQIAAPPGAQDKAREFYGSLLGLKELEVPLPLRDRATTWFQCGPLQIHIGIQQNFQPAKKAHPAFVTTHLQELRARLQSYGVPTVEDHDRPGIARFFAEDPWGNRLEFMETIS